jgi:hypothetical protein
VLPLANKKAATATIPVDDDNKILRLLLLERGVNLN